MDETTNPVCRCGEAIAAALVEVLDLARRQPAPLLTVEQAAERLGVARTTLARWVSEKKVSHTRIAGGNTVRFTEQNLIDIIAAGARRVPPPIDGQGRTRARVLRERARRAAIDPEIAEDFARVSRMVKTYEATGRG